jgi:hypothetical protein
MDEIENSDNKSTDAMDAWNDHVQEVEQAAENVMTCFSGADLVVVRACGDTRVFEIPTFTYFTSFFDWFMRQVRLVHAPSAFKADLVCS